jgi:hypothetical protein
MDTTKTGHKWPNEEIINQIRITRESKNLAGHIHWNMKSLLRNDTLCRELEQQVYVQPALLPLTPWLGKKQPPKPTLDFHSDSGKLVLNWRPAGTNRVSSWLLQKKTAGSWSMQLLPENAHSVSLNTPFPEAFSVSAVDRLANCSAPVTFQKR